MKIAENAAREGQPIDAFVVARLTRDLQTAVEAPESKEYEAGYDPATDSLARFAGMYASKDSGWLQRHDEIFGKNQTNKE